jgi:Tfp pilus assembly pilus retraction ATPase PilT
MYAMDDLLNLVNAEKAEELHLDFGVPPATQVQGELHTIEGPPIGSENIELLLQSIASEQQIQDIKKRGNAKFIYPFGDASRFRVIVTTRGNGFNLKLYNLEKI